MKDCRPVIKQAREYIAIPGNIVGGNLHVVLEDANLGDGSVRYCLELARAAGDKAGVALSEALLDCSRTQRAKIALSCWKPEEPR